MDVGLFFQAKETYWVLPEEKFNVFVKANKKEIENENVLAKIEKLNPSLTIKTIK